MATSNEDTVAMSRESVGSGPVLVSDGTPHKTDLSGTTRTRKKVTFDLDLQVRTIPNRIPIYERRPAYNNSSHTANAYARSNQAVAFYPRPLDIRTRDRYLIGATHLSAKKIIDLFNVPNGYQNYPAPPKGQYTCPGQPGWRRQHQVYGAGDSAGNASSRHPAYTFASMKSSKLSRAAANLKQITAALGEQFDSSVYQEWDMSRSTGRNDGGGSAGSQRGTETVDSSTPGAVNKHAPPHSPFQSFTTTRTRSYLPYRQQLNVQPDTPPNTSPDSASDANITVSPLLERPRSTSYPAGTIASTRRLSVVSSEQMPLNEKHLVISKAPATNQRSDSRRRSDNGFHSGTDLFRRVPSARDRERAPSRCSTIDTYVISPLNRISSARSNSGRRMIPSPNKSRPVAWEGAEISVTEPALTANALRTTAPDNNTTTGSNTGQSNWHVTSN